ncbi:MAG: ROK family transcriptional regulator [Solirubrobacterales bacterium]
MKPLSEKHWLVLDSLRSKGAEGATRAGLAAELKMTWPTVNEALSRLSERGMIADNSGVCTVNPNWGCFIGIDIGSTVFKPYLLNFAFDSESLMEDDNPISTGGGNPVEIQMNLRHFIADIIEQIEQRGQNLIGLGLAWPGAVKNNRLKFSEGGEIDITRVISLIDTTTDKQLTVGNNTVVTVDGEPRTVEEDNNMILTVDNASMCGLVAEKELGLSGSKPRPEKNIFYVSLRTNIGSASLINDQLCRGSHNLAGNFGNIIVPHDPECLCKRINGGSSADVKLKEEISPKSLEKLAYKMFGIEAKPEEFQKWAEKTPKDQDWSPEQSRGGLEIYEHFGRYLAKGLASVINILDPDAIILAGGLSRAYHLFSFPMFQELHRLVGHEAAEAVPIEPAHFMPRSGPAIGAAIMAYKKWQKTLTN